MKLLHELNQLEMGGAERVVLGIIKHDKKNEHSIYTYKDGPMRTLLENAGAKVIVEKGEQVNMDVDLIHIHTGGDESTVAKCVRGVIPTVETVHSPVVSKVRDNWIKQRIGVSGVVTGMNRKCRTIYNGIDIDRLVNDLEPEQAKTALGIDPDAFVIGRLGRIGTDKCLEEFLVASWKFQKMFPDRKIAVLICGDEAKSNPGYLAKVKVMAASFPLKNVKFVPATENVAPIYTAMDVFMYPSPTEGFGLVYFEAMACGVPVLTWKNKVTEELLQGSAMLMNPTVNRLVEGLRTMMLENAVRMEIADAGRDTAINHFSEQRMSGNYQDLYEQVVPQLKEEPVVA